jgi:peptidoglycan/xylan/chitin deacetylase (PgdA/CDA1 family)
VWVAVVSAFATVVPVGFASSGHAATNTTVVLTFDDQWGSQTTSRSLLESHGMRGTFFINSNRVGMSGNLSWAQLQAFQASGHEIAGHTLDHVDLTTLSAAQMQTQVCDDRTAIISHGITPPTDFAYPDGSGWDDDDIQDVIQSCGYSSARRADGLRTNGGPYAETIPPGDVFAIKTAEMPDSSFSLATIEGFVTAAETHGGGMVTIVFHDNLATLGPFLDWLQPRAADGTVTKTMAEALGGDPTPTDTQAPTSSIACDGASCSGFHTAAAQISLSAVDNAGGSGVASIRYTTNGSTPSLSSPSYTAPFTLSSSTTVRYRAYDNAGNAESTKSQLVQIDAAAPVSSISCDGETCSGSAYGAAVEVALEATDGAGSGVDAIHYTTDGSQPSPASPVYDGPFTVSATATVRYRAYDEVGNAESTNSQLVPIDTDAPSTAIECGGRACSSGWYRKPVQVSLSATDGDSGVAAIHYTVDGSTPTPASPVYAQPFTLPATSHVRCFAVDNAGNVSGVTTKLLRIDTSGPTAALKSTRSAGRIKVSVTAADARSGVARVYLYVDGRLVTKRTQTRFAYSRSIRKGAHKVGVRVFDKAGNSTTKKITISVH